MAKRLTYMQFTTRCHTIHNFKYDYSQTTYVNMHTKINITCPVHGEFVQTPDNHIHGHGCPLCGVDTVSKQKFKTTEEFISRVMGIHKSKYDYSCVLYERSNKKVKIICPKHGIFLQKPDAHINGDGCPSCKRSKGEEAIAKLLSLNGIIFEEQKKFEKCKSNKGHLLKFDFYIPLMDICIEYDGKQHFHPIEYFGGQTTLSIIKERDYIKNKFCQENKIDLIRIKSIRNIQKELQQRRII